MENLKELSSSANDWLKHNRKSLRKYRGQWIAYNGEDGIIAHDKDATKVMRVAEASGKWHVIKFLHPYFYGRLRRLVPIHFRPLHQDV